MQKTKKAIVLLNMGGARNKNELKMFLTNMFNDENILTVNAILRKIIAFFIVKSRLNSAWKNYEEIGNESPINKLTQDLVKKVNKAIPEYKTYQVMRYTPPFANEVIKQMKEDGIEEVVLFPLYPQYSTTTTKSSLDDFAKFAKDSFKTRIIDPFYKNKIFNECILDEIILKSKEIKTKSSKDFNLIFSAHGLPLKIVDAGDPYEKQMTEHVEILTKMLNDKKIKFKSISLAYQSKVGPLKWLEPSLDDALTSFKDENVLIYPLAFIIDNSETDFELSIEYKEIADEIGINEYKICKCVNASDKFVSAIKNIIE